MNEIISLINNSKYSKYLDDIVHFMKEHEQFILSFNKIEIPTVSEISRSFLYHDIHLFNEPEFIELLVKCIDIISNNNYDYTNTENIFNNKLNNEINTNNLFDKGLLIIPDVFTQHQCSEMLDMMNNKPIREANFKNRYRIPCPFNTLNLHEDHVYSHVIDPYKVDFLSIDFVQHFITNPFLLNTLQNYLGTTPIFYSWNFNASYPSNKDTTQEFHQDFDELKFLKVFVYLNDVDNDNGPHCYIQNSIKTVAESNMLKKYNYQRKAQRFQDKIFIDNGLEDDITFITGKAGTIIIENTRGIHRGTVLKSGKRFMLQFFFGTSNVSWKSTYSDYKKIVLNEKKSHILKKAKDKYPHIFQNLIFKS